MAGRFIGSVLIGLALVAGCQPPGGPGRTSGGPIRVVATTSIVADLAREVGGPTVEVITLMPAGTDPHNYSPAAGDADRLGSADLVLFSGLHLEGKMTDLLEHSTTTRAVAVTRDLPTSDLRTVDGGTATDPHVWFDVALWAKCVPVVRDEFSAIDPAHAADYAHNAATYGQTLAALDAEVRQHVGTIPPAQRRLVTSHDAFGYFARAYGFEVRGLQGISTAFATGSRDLTDLAAYIRDNRVPAIFTETSTPTRGLKSVLESVPGVKLVGEGDALYSDSLGQPGTPAGTYVGMVRHNARVLVKYLSR